ncbi:MAG: hypothetical protein ACFFBI_02495 [Promethearchaeota archaeon]
MERNYKTIFIIINIIFVFSLIIIPTSIIYTKFVNLGRIDKTLTYKYSSETPPFKKDLNLITDVGIIDIKYTTQQVDYLVKIDVDIELAGPNLNGKSYLDVFDINWENSTSPLNFNLELIPNMLAEFSNLQNFNVKIDVSLRADIVFDINASTVDGTIGLTNLMSITVSNLYLKVERGNINYDSTNCTIEGNITGIVNNGDITLKSYNNQFTQNSKFTIKNVKGYVLIDIYQYEEMGANVTGTAITETGIIRINYKDVSSNVGARFVFYNKNTFGPETETIWIGFNADILPSEDGLLLVSYDFPTKNNYNFSLYKFSTTSGDFHFDLYSFPITA